MAKATRKIPTECSVVLELTHVEAQALLEVTGGSCGGDNKTDDIYYVLYALGMRPSEDRVFQVDRDGLSFVR